ncbi:MAG: fumarylacetoacetate hydrolase family protein [Rhodobacteraceae bacterium]|jgi:2-keto-4-pentenoate hydratase/2-oxohepta-3-ene-1,7-dioic acid hydratase in catechol pathway|nr:fumarylacetoacetate hydrolase family protein [Paracoccaceae bacterium]
MKLLTGTAPDQGKPQVFAVIDGRAVLLAEGDLTHIIAAQAAGGTLPAPAPDAPNYDLAQITPTRLLDRPGKIVCLGLNYAEHAREGGYDVPDYPAMFLRAATSMIAAEAPMILPKASVTFDYEAELMVIVGKGGRHIKQADALNHVFGYSVFNDGSVRDYQRKTHQWTAGKNFDGTGAVGPFVVTPDELPEGASGLRISTRLNGRVLQDSNTSDMIFPVARTIAIVSEIMTLEPGDMIAFGTPPGVGHARKPQVWMKAGDVVEVEIEGIGICRNPIQAEGDEAAQGFAAQ